MADDLDQLQPRHRVEEVQPEQPLGPRKRAAQILQRNARGVGRKNSTRFHLRLKPGIDLLLQLQLFRHRLDDEVGVADAFGLHVRHQPVECIADIGTLAQDLAEQFRRALDGAGDRLRLHVGERDPHILAGAPGGDIAAHRTGADHVNMRDLVAGAGELLHLLAQEEHADQVLRGWRHHQAGERRLLSVEHRSFVATVLFPEVDQRVRRGIVLLGCSLAGLGAHPRGEQAPHRAEIENGIEQPWPRAREAAGNRVLHSVADMPLLRDGVYQSQRFRLSRIDGLAGQHQGHRLHRINQMREAHRAAKAGMQAEHHFRKAEPGIVDCDPHLAGQRHL